jgi:hypothetical protein
MELGGIENCAFIEVAGSRIRGEPDPTRENTSAEGKASRCNSSAFSSFSKKSPRSARRARILVGFDHPGYAHMARLPEPVRAALAEDFD